MSEIRGLSLTQPWASLMVRRAKMVETRGWKTGYRGWVAIHAAKGFPGDAKDFATCQVVRSIVEPAIVEASRGHIIGLGKLTAIYPTETFVRSESEKELRQLLIGNTIHISEQEFNFGNYDPHRFGWIFTDLVELKAPISYRGALNLWPFDTAGHYEVEEILRKAA